MWLTETQRIDAHVTWCLKMQSGFVCLKFQIFPNCTIGDKLAAELLFISINLI